MKHVTASEARKNWFKLLDEAAAGAVIAIDRNDKRLVLQLESVQKKKTVPDYKKLIQGHDLDNADKWGWEWSESKGMVVKNNKTRKD